MHGQGNHPNGLVALKLRILARMALFGQDSGIVEALDVQVTLAVESGQKVVYVRCILGEQVCGLRPAPFVI